jgi:hypothetical protein
VKPPICERGNALPSVLTVGHVHVKVFVTAPAGVGARAANANSDARIRFFLIAKHPFPFTSENALVSHIPGTNASNADEIAAETKAVVIKPLSAAAASPVATLVIGV